jgi:hypothetical protein
VEKALAERPLRAVHPMPSIVLCSDEEVTSFLAGETAPVPEPGDLDGREGYISRSSRAPRHHGWIVGE